MAKLTAKQIERKFWRLPYPYDCNLARVAPYRKDSAKWQASIYNERTDVDVEAERRSPSYAMRSALKQLENP